MPPDRIKIRTHAERMVMAKTSLDWSNALHRQTNRASRVPRDGLGREQSNLRPVYFDAHVSLYGIDSLLFSETPSSAAVTGLTSSKPSVAGCGKS